MRRVKHWREYYPLTKWVSKLPNFIETEYLFMDKKRWMKRLSHYLDQLKRNAQQPHILSSNQFRRWWKRRRKLLAKLRGQKHGYNKK